MNVSSENLRLIGWGAVSMVLGLLAPKLITVKDFGIIALAERSLMTGDVASLFFAAVRLVALNALRALPLYVGVLLISEGLGMFDSRANRWLRLCLLLLIPLMYEAVRLMYGIMYDFGVPAVTLLFIIILVTRNRNMTRSVPHKVIVFALLVFGVQWLDIVEMLTGYGFGRGDISSLLKYISLINAADNLLNVMGISLCIIFVTNAFIIARLLNIYTKEIKAVEHALDLENLNHQLKLQSIENRSLREIQSLVHDLKTPLTSIQGLAGVISICDDIDMTKRHANYICNMVDKMNIMINELLQDDSRQIIGLRDLIEYTVAHVPQLDSIAEFKLLISGDGLVEVNKIKVARALINILENALDAVEGKEGCIVLQAEKMEDGYWMICVTDNGSGLKAENSDEVWEIGFSTKQSSGLGLAFVRDVIEKNGGHISMTNQADGGVKVVIKIPEV